MKLTIQDRVVFGQLLPKSGNILDQTLAKELMNKIEIISEEREKVGLVAEGSAVKWVDSTYTKEVSFSDFELNYLKGRVDVLDKEKRVTQDNLSLLTKIQQAQLKKK